MRISVFEIGKPIFSIFAIQLVVIEKFRFNKIQNHGFNFLAVFVNDFVSGLNIVLKYVESRVEQFWMRKWFAMVTSWIHCQHLTTLRKFTNGKSFPQNFTDMRLSVLYPVSGKVFNPSAFNYCECPVEWENFLWKFNLKTHSFVHQDSKLQTEIGMSPKLLESSAVHFQSHNLWCWNKSISLNIEFQ